MSNSQDLSGGSTEVNALGIGVAIGVAGTTIVAVTVCCICYACHRMRYATQVAWLHTPTKTLLLVFNNLYTTEAITMLGFCILQQMCFIIGSRYHSENKINVLAFTWRF